VVPKDGEPPLRSQQRFLDLAAESERRSQQLPVPAERPKLAAGVNGTATPRPPKPAAKVRKGRG
jgi:hypothetical protein